MSKVVRIDTRKSTLVLIQTQLMAGEPKRACPGLKIEVATKDTLGDRILDGPLQEFGGKGVFVSESEQAVKARTIGLAMHNAKDLPMELTPGLYVAAVSHHEDPGGVLVTMKGTMEAGREIIGIGTSSPRRQLGIVENREILWPGSKGVQCNILRGNIHTRLKRLEEGSFDGVVLVAAGLRRLDLLRHDGHDFHFLRPNLFIPAGSQGLMTVGAREENEAAALCQAMDHQEGRLCLTLERAVLQLLDAGCHESVGIFSQFSGERMKVWGINRKDNITKHACLEGGITLREIRQMTEQARKGLD